jgi:hypothetical protein
MATVQQPTSAQQRRVQWKPVDRALARFSSDSLLALLHAALGSPGCSRFHDHLLLLWTRVLRTTSHPGDQAGAGDLPGLVEVVMSCAPGRGTVTETEPNDPRALVGFKVAGERLLVHPGQLDHPLMFLRSAQLTALAIDEPLLTVHGFTLTDVLELVLRYTDHAVRALAPAWPQAYEDRGAEEIACGISPGEGDAAQGLADLDPSVITDACRNPERAQRALDWLTADLADLPLRYHPTAPLLGPVLAVVAHGRRRLVPVSAALNSFAAALERLLATVPDPQGAEERLQKLTVDRVAQLFGLDEAPARPGPVCVISSPGYRYDIAVVSALAGAALSGRIEEGRSALADGGAPGRGRLVVYGGPRVLGPEVIRDTAFLHVEELAEILADAEGDPSLPALFVLELTEHPGVDAVLYREPLDAWTEWRRESTLLLPGPYREGAAVVSPAAGFDTTWRRAATWARLDDVLAATGLPQALDWRIAHLAEPDPGVLGEHADLLHPGHGGGGLVVRISTVPPLAVVASPCPEPDAVLDLSAMTGLADSIRTTITGCPPVAAHFTLPDGAPVVVELNETTQPHQLPPAEPGGQHAEEHEAGERLLLHAGTDSDQARIGIDLDPPLLDSFTGDGHQGHRILGRLLHHLVEQVRQARGAGPGTDPEAFAEAWDGAYPVLRITGATTYWPATAPHYTLPRSLHLHARALHTAAAAIRRAGVPAGSWNGPDAYASGGPADQLLHALEDELTQQIRAHQPSLVEELARQLNAAWSSRTRGHHEMRVNLAAPWAANWAPEAAERQSDAATATSALQLLLQQAIVTPPAGRRPVDVLAVAELVALAELVRHCGTTAVAASRRLHDLHLETHPSGVFTLTDTGEADTPDPDAELVHLGFDADAYQRARHERFLAQAATTPPELLDDDVVFAGPGARTETVAASDLPATSQLAQADRILHQHWHCGFAALSAVLATAADWPTGPEGIATITPEDLVREATTRSGLPEADLTAAVDRLSLHPGNAAGTGPHAYTEVERRTRPATHPLITHDGRLLVLPWLVHTAQELYAAYLDEGRLPHPDLPQPVRKALRHHREQLDKRLEADLQTIARDAGLPHRYRLLEKTAAQLGIPGLIGEIDLLIADPATQRLWVIEAKNPEGAVAPHAVIQHIQRFTKDYLGKLLDKTATITAHATAAARACQAPEDLDWEVIPLMVTRSIEPAAFLTDPKVPFTIADHLAQILTAPTTPRPGWNSPDGAPR